MIIITTYPNINNTLPPPGGFFMTKPRKEAPGFLDPGGAGGGMELGFLVYL